MIDDIINTMCEDCATNLVDMHEPDPDSGELAAADDDAARDALWEMRCDCGQLLCYQCWSNPTHEGHRS